MAAYAREIGSGELFADILEEIEINGISLTVKSENSKLKKGNGVIYIIWNLPCYITCPNATEACKVACYAEAPEKDFRKGVVLPARYRNLAACTGDNAETFEHNMIETIEKLLKTKSYKEAREIRVRIHESGDFFSKAYSDSWLRIARHFRKVKNIVFMAYTKSFSFFDGVKLPGNFVLRASIWQDTTSEDLETIKRNKWPIYMAVPAEMVRDMPKRYILCTCEDCSTCEKHCFTRKNKDMFVVLHGREAKKLHKDVPRLKKIVAMF